MDVKPGDKIGLLTVVSLFPTPHKGKPNSKVKLMCDCGNEVIVWKSQLSRRKSCGCVSQGSWKWDASPIHITSAKSKAIMDKFIYGGYYMIR